MTLTTVTTLVTGHSAGAREAAIASALDPDVDTTLILEGLASATAFPDFPKLRIMRIAAGCLCCTGSLTMRVTLNRVLRQSPQRLFISLANSEHLEKIRSSLRQSPYDNLLALTNDLAC
jgi:hypothetical protein